MALMALSASAQENLQRSAVASDAKKSFTVVKQLPITSIKNQHRSGTCWDYATLAFLESEILRQSGRTFDLCEMFVVNHDYMDKTESKESVLICEALVTASRWPAEPEAGGSGHRS